MAITGSSKPSGYSDFIIWRQDPPAIYGITTQRVWPEVKEQCACNKFGWSIKLIVCTSRRIPSCIIWKRKKKEKNWIFNMTITQYSNWILDNIIRETQNYIEQHLFLLLTKMNYVQRHSPPNNRWQKNTT